MPWMPCSTCKPPTMGRAVKRSASPPRDKARRCKRPRAEESSDSDSGADEYSDTEAPEQQDQGVRLGRLERNLVRLVFNLCVLFEQR